MSQGETFGTATGERSNVSPVGRTESRVRRLPTETDGDGLKAGGVTAGLDLALWLLEREFCADVSTAVEAELEYERPMSIVVTGEA